jgi:hypothetical protein
MSGAALARHGGHSGEGNDRGQNPSIREASTIVTSFTANTASARSFLVAKWTMDLLILTTG